MSVQKHLTNGHNVAVEAVPGAGKTHLILKICDDDDVPSLVLAYNRELAEKVTGMLRKDTQTTCVTFHSLCSKCLAPARDDNQLLKIVEDAEKGNLLPTDVPVVDRIFVDEAQDVRDLYVRLIKVLGLLRPTTRVVVAGDRNQLVYDFDDDFPATLATLQTPETTFGVGQWKCVVLNNTHRLTRQTCAVVNRMFGTDIRSDKEGPRVELRAPRNMFSGLYDTLRDVLLGDDDVLLLVDRKNGNRALRTLLNKVSRSGRRRVHVHGISTGTTGTTTSAVGNDGDLPSGIIRCGTFWSAKGLEASTVVVLLPGSAPFNPTYVALTRSSHRLVVVLDPKDPHPLMCHVAQPSLVTIETEWTQRVVEQGASRATDTSFTKRARYTSELRCLDRHVPRSSVIDAVVGVSMYNTFPSPTQLEDGDAALGPVATRMGLVLAEYESQGTVRAMTDILHPTRLEYDQIPDAIRLGLASRTVPKFVSDDELLAPDLRTLASRAYRNMEFFSNLANVSLAILSWDSWDCTMRSMQPTREWALSVRSIVDEVVEAIPPTATFDVRLLDARKTCHARVHATTSEKCYHVVWDVSSTEVGQALVRAALHPRRSCVLVQASTGRAAELRVTDTQAISLLADD